MYPAWQKQRPIHPRKSLAIQGEIDQLRKASFIYQIAYTLGYIIQACPRLEELPVGNTFSTVCSGSALALLQLDTSRQDEWARIGQLLEMVMITTLK